MKLNAMVCVFGMMCMVSWGEAVLPGGVSLPTLTKQESAVTAGMASMRLREAQDVYLMPGTDGTVAVTLENARVIANNAPLAWRLHDSYGTVLDSGSIPVSQSLKLKTRVLPRGLYRLHLDADANSARVSCASGVCFVKPDFQQPFHAIFECPKLYFLTRPSADGKVHLDVWGQAGEDCRATVWDATGRQVYDGATRTPEGRGVSLNIAVPLPAEQVGRAWSIQLTALENKAYRFEDMFILLKDGAVPALGLTPSALAVPGTRRVLERMPDGGCFVGVELSEQLMAQPGVVAEFAFEYGMDGKVTDIYRDAVHSGDGRARVGLAVKRNGKAIGRIRFTAKDASGKPIDTWNESFYIMGNTLFTEVIREEEGTPAEPTAVERSRGYQIFQRDEPGFVRRYSRPSSDELIGELTGECSPFMVSTEFFALQPLKDFSGVTLSVSDLSGPGGAVLPASSVGLFTLKPHLQKVEYSKREVIDIPEAFDRNVTVSLTARLPQLYCVQTTVPADAVPGVYRGMLRLDGKDILPYSLTVDDFLLPEDPAMSFGLYPDTERWVRFKYTDAQILAELTMFREYGITALLMYPMETAKLSWNGTTLSVDLTEFRRHVGLMKAAGYYGVLVVDLQSALKKQLPAAVGIKGFSDKPELWSAFRDLLTAIRQAAIEDNWPWYCIHTTDEPSQGNLKEMAIKSLKITHEMGFRTFNTCYADFVRSHLDPFLDYRCYNNVCYGSCPTESVTRQLRQESLEAGDEFWWYGSGCYCNGGFLQDGNIYANRHMLGVFNWRTKATGAWSWTFWRGHGNQFDDFDGGKDECMAFQDTASNTIISSLQWEGVREGIYDHRYLKLWENTVKRARTRPALQELAAASETRVFGCLDGISWTARKFAVRNGQLRRLRRLLIKEITALNKAMR